MKTKFKKNGKRLLAAVLCLVMAVMALPMSAFAWTSEEGVSCTSSFGDYYVGSDGEYYRSKSSYSFIVYDSDGNTSVRTISAGNAKRKYLMTDSDGTHQVYCVESGIDFNTGNSYVSQNGKNSSYFRKLPTEAQFGVMMALMYIYTAIAPVPLSTFAGEPSQSVGKSFIKSYAAVCLEGAIIVLACIIFSLFAASPPAVDPNAAAVSMVWSYIGELVFNMLVLVGAVKMSDRVVREMMGL